MPVASFRSPTPSAVPELRDDGRSRLVLWHPDAALPALTPDRRSWPCVAVLLAGTGEGWQEAATRASLARQGYPALDVVAVRPGSTAAEAAEGLDAEYVLALQPGDQLAPGAVAALALAARMEDADVVSGLRVLVRNGRALALDILRPSGAGSALRDLPGDVLIRRAVLRRSREASSAGSGSPGDARHPVPFSVPLGDGFPAQASNDRLRVARIARPVLLREAGPDEVRPGRPWTVAAVNDSGAAGGAGIAHRRLIDALRLGGHAVGSHRLNDLSPPVAAEWTERFDPIEDAVAARAPDLILAGNLHGATRTTTILGRLAGIAPTAAVLHDLFPLTGRCAHPGPCRRIERGCDAACPTPDLYPQLAPGRIAAVHAEKRAVLASGVALLANSRWTDGQARALAPPGTRIGRIDLPCPGQVFRPPRDRAALRRRLGLPPDDVLILFGAVIADQPDKGGADLVAALRRVAGPGIGFVALGRIDDPRAFPLPGLLAPGPIADEEELAAWYGACDLHVTASRLETFGQTVVEAGLCGVPGVAYRLTGLQDAVIDGVSGLLVDPTPEALAAAVASLARDADRRRDLGAWGRIALEGRNSHAAALLSLRDALDGTGLIPDDGRDDDRVHFPPDLLRAFAMSADPLPGEAGTVSRPPSRLAAALRRAKQRVWGRRQPAWMRRALLLLHRLRAGWRGPRSVHAGRRP